jgi:hypothetical protein
MESGGVTLITPTGGRPAAFVLCKKYVLRQTYHTPIQWIIVDDGDPSTIQTDFQLDTLATILYPKPKWQSGQNTLARNILAALPEIQYNRILFIEDDDWYSPEYLEFMCKMLEKHEIVGETPARYYHIPFRQYRLLPNAHHASLCQTGIRFCLLHRLQKICQRPSATFIDVQLWEGMSVAGLSKEPGHCVGIKGLPGRPGIGVGHRPEGESDWKQDPDLSVLKIWVGKEDAEAYYG